ncbi:trypsin-like peptidase domain-containing protein [Anaeromyxobacter oryzae]|uniref:Peptidase n=1 Tax=Anaeromyxobacter oryzae TaxID=2918170 RepID=A0ABM7X490_9BACT|nr:trypsin-like peptidase domain-containing protein [Anaeromyxobacter oryzae]BDG06626.1 peptidase [Anaeromyxobacter oryzae]
MPRIISRFLTVTVAVSATVLAILACSQNGRAATDGARDAPTAQLFRDAAATGPEASVPAQMSLAPLIEKLRPAVVNISTTTVTKHPRVSRAPRGTPRNPHGQGGPGGQGDDGYEDYFERFFGRPAPEAPEEFKGSSLGSGFVLNGDGYILTNNHVVKDASDIRVTLDDGREFVATVVGTDPLTDVALIRLKNPPKNLPTLVLGSSENLRQGDYVLALGSPFGLRATATLGIVSAKHRAGINPGGTYDDFIQTDAAINPGNSGGPLFNLKGEVVGINTAIVSPQIGQGIGFAVPIDLAKAILPQLKDKGKVTRGFLGVSVSELTPDLIQAFGLPQGTKGALVQNVVPKSPAAKAGIQAGDVVTGLNGKPIDSSGSLTRAVALIPPGGSADLTVVRGGDRKQFGIKVAQRPDDESAVGRGESEGEGEGGPAKDQTPKLGVSLAPLTADLARQLGVSGDEGVAVVDVVDGGPADRAGIRKGDLILEVNRRPVKKPDDVRAAVGKLKDGDMVLLRVRRGDQAVFVAVPVGGRQ